MKETPFSCDMTAIEPECGNVLLKICGRESVKEFIKAVFGNYLTNNISWE